MTIAQIILYPFSMLYGVGIRIRNFLYESGLKRTNSFSVKVISVGNLSVGGTGKTPTVEYLVDLLYRQKKIAVLSRGYRRKSKGFVAASADSTIDELGDEPFQIYNKLGVKCSVYVCEGRSTGIQKILENDPDTDLVVLDDAYQHRKVDRDLNILLTDFSRPFFRDYLVPSGRLREPRSEAKRADLVIVTKIPEEAVNENIEKYYQRMIQSYASLYDEDSIFFSRIDYADPVTVYGNSDLSNGEKVLTFSGLANDDSFIEHSISIYQQTDHLRFPDHWHYNRKDVEKLLHVAKEQEAALLTTEKDVNKLKVPQFKEIFIKSGISLYFLPIRTAFVKKGKEFDAKVIDCINT